jgi:hypothetical protein
MSRVRPMNKQLVAVMNSKAMLVNIQFMLNTTMLTITISCYPKNVMPWLSVTPSNELNTKVW